MHPVSRDSIIINSIFFDGEIAVNPRQTVYSDTLFAMIIASTIIAILKQFSSVLQSDGIMARQNC